MPVLREELRPRGLRPDGPAVQKRRDPLLFLFFFPCSSSSSSSSPLALYREKSRGDVAFVVFFPFEGCFVPFQVVFLGHERKSKKKKGF